MTRPPRRNDPEPTRQVRPPRPHSEPRPKTDPDAWVWGRHAVEAALANPGREISRLLVAPDKLRTVDGKLGERAGRLRAEATEMADIGRQLPVGAAHQGYALRAGPPPSTDLQTLAAEPGVLVMLDQVTDPQNVGAVFRSAAAFGAKGVILQDRNTPALGGVIAKASAGAVDVVPHARVVNLSRALETLAEAGWRGVALDGTAKTTLEAAFDGRPTVLVLGSEGEGVRRLVAEHCDVSARIPMPGGFESLNVAATAAIALYEATRPRGG